MTEDAVAHLRALARRYSADEVIARLDDLRSLKVAVVGDVIIDEYHYCSAVGKSSKSATLTARFLSEERQAGGILAVANHVGGFVDEVHLVTYRGEPASDEEFIRGHLRPSVRPHLIADPGRPTVVKRRYVDPFQVSKMLEVMWLPEEEGPRADEGALARVLETVVPDCDLVLVSDFGHGTITAPTIEWLGNVDAYLAVNAQANSANFGFNVITQYPRCDYFCIDEQELRLANHERHGDILPLLEQTARRLGCRMATVTRGTRGSVTWQAEGRPVASPVLTTDVVDSVGAGDAFLSLTSLCARAGFEPDLLGFIGNCAGAVAVGIVGNREPISPELIYEQVRSRLDGAARGRGDATT